MFPGHILNLKGLVRCAGFLLVLAVGVVAGPAMAADDVSEMRNTCSVSGGTSTSSSEHFSCCWPGWGCVHCAVSDGQIYADQCWTDCDSQACRDANAGDRLGLPPTKKPPAAKTPGTTPGTVTPQQTPKPKVPTVPGGNTLQQ
jgi:hypothetical protein